MKHSITKTRILTGILVIAVITGGLLWRGPSGPGTSDQALDDSNMHYAGPFKVAVMLDPEKPKVGNNQLMIVLRDKDNQPVSDATIKAVAEMPAMGSMQAMQAPATMTLDDPGVYSGTFELSMAGAWPLTLDITSPTIGQASLTFDLTTSRGGLRLTEATPTTMARKSTGTVNPVPLTKKDVQPGSFRVDARRRQLIGVTTGKVQRKQLTQTIRAAGRVKVDETRLTDISLKFDGWIGKLRANYEGAPVTKGQTLFTVYSPDLVSAQEEYLETRRHRKRDNDSLLIAARRRLSLWDIGPYEVRTLEKRGRAEKYVPILSPVNGTVIEKNIVDGSAIKAGMKLLRIADLSRVWIEGQVYEYELPQVTTGMDATVVLPEMEGRTIPGKVTYVSPYLESDTRTANIRVELDNADGLLRPDMYAHVHLSVDLGERLVVPESAVLYAGTSRVVFLDLGEGRLQPRKIKTGLRNNDDIEVIDGLSEGDVVVTSGNFLIAAESKLKSGIDQW